jgi:hypothetical protein
MAKTLSGPAKSGGNHTGFENPVDALKNHAKSVIWSTGIRVWGHGIFLASARLETHHEGKPFFHGSTARLKLQYPCHQRRDCRLRGNGRNRVHIAVPAKEALSKW